MACIIAACKQSTSQPLAQPTEEGNVTDKPETAAHVAPAVAPSPVPSPSPAYPGIYVGTPTLNPTPAGRSDDKDMESYIVQPGETLSLIAAVFGCTVDEVAAANGLADVDSISVGQELHIPITPAESGPTLKLLPDSEMVYGPAYIHFDLVDFVAQQGGYLVDYTEQVEESQRSGAEIVQLISQRFSVGPRVLLTLLELRSGWVTQPEPASETLIYPLGHIQDYYEGLYSQLSWAAVRLNQGYYGWKRGNRTTMRLAQGSRIGMAPGINPGTAGVQNCLAELSISWDEWEMMTGPGGFPGTYELLFGNPFAYTVEPLVPSELAQPELRLPWEAGATWYFTGGPHGGWGDGSGRAALDFAPPEHSLGCMPSDGWVTAAASGWVLRSENGEVIVDLDGDGFEQSGWVLLYMHVHEEGRVEANTFVQRGQRIGHPSCEGGYAEATHVHLARRYNGEWISAGSGPTPMILSGWMAHEDTMPYDGTMTRSHEVRTACECWEEDVNGLVSDNGP